MNLIKIDGGIGKNIAFTGLIQTVYEDMGEFAIETAYPDVFVGLPHISMIYNSAEPKDPRKFYSHFDRVFASDPYVGTFFNGETHLLSAWSEQILNKPIHGSNTLLPKLVNDITKEEQDRIKKIIGDKPYFVIQISGGQSPYEFNDSNSKPEYTINHMRAGRNMGKMDDLYNQLKEIFPDHTMVQIALPNEPQLKDAVQIPAHYRTWFNIFEKSDFFIGIDSMMAHAMAAYKKPGIVFWDMNSPKQFGWEYDGRFDYSTILPNGVHIDKKLATESLSKLKTHLDTTTIIKLK